MQKSFTAINLEIVEFCFYLQKKYNTKCFLSFQFI